VAARKCGFPWRAMLRHGRLLPGRLTGQTAKPQERTRRSASLHGENQWRATVPRGRAQMRLSTEGHALSWPPIVRPPYGTNRKAPRTDATERVPPRKIPWRATVPRGRKRRHPTEGHAPSWPPLVRPPYGTNRKAPRTDATERVPPGKGPDPALEGHGPSWPRANAAFHGGPCSVMAASCSAALRDKPQSPKNGRDGARPSRNDPESVK